MPRLTFLLFVASLLLSSLVIGQTREDAARDDLGYGNRSRPAQDNEGGDIWYGAGATLGFSANQFSSLFRIGVAPMVGYKFNNFLSAGPRASVVYSRFSSDVFKDNSINWAVGLFARAKVFRSFFVHAEYSLLNEREVNPINGFWLDGRVVRAIPFLGGGINQGGGPGSAGFEFMVLFRLIQPDRINDAPYEIRSGFTYNF